MFSDRSAYGHKRYRSLILSGKWSNRFPLDIAGTIVVYLARCFQYINVDKIQHREVLSILTYFTYQVNEPEGKLIQLPISAPTFMNMLFGKFIAAFSFEAFWTFSGS